MWSRKSRRILLFAALLFLGGGALAPFLGESIDFGWARDRAIFFDWRLPRALLGLFAGAGLAMAGVVFQAILKNPLATPYTLGVSSGAGVGRDAAARRPAAASTTAPAATRPDVARTTQPRLRPPNAPNDST